MDISFACIRCDNTLQCHLHPGPTDSDKTYLAIRPSSGRLWTHCPALGPDSAIHSCFIADGPCPSWASWRGDSFAFWMDAPCRLTAFDWAQAECLGHPALRGDPVDPADPADLDDPADPADPGGLGGRNNNRRSRSRNTDNRSHHTHHN